MAEKEKIQIQRLGDSSLGWVLKRVQSSHTKEADRVEFTRYGDAVDHIYDYVKCNSNQELLPNLFLNDVKSLVINPPVYPVNAINSILWSCQFKNVYSFFYISGTGANRAICFMLYFDVNVGSYKFDFIGDFSCHFNELIPKKLTLTDDNWDFLGGDPTLRPWYIKLKQRLVSTGSPSYRILEILSYFDTNPASVTGYGTAEIDYLKSYSSLLAEHSFYLSVLGSSSIPRVEISEPFIPVRIDSLSHDTPLVTPVIRLGAFNWSNVSSAYTNEEKLANSLLRLFKDGFPPYGIDAQMSINSGVVTCLSGGDFVFYYLCRS